MKHLLTLFAFIFCFGTQAQSSNPAELIISTRSPVSSSNPLVVINGEQTAMGAYVLEPEKIKHIEVLKGQQATDKYGESAREGAVIITLKEQPELVRLAQVYAHLDIPVKQQKLKVAIDGNMVQKPELLLIALSSIKKAEVTKAENPFASGGKEKFLNLITR